MRPKVLFVINSLAGGGAERVFSAILQASQDRAGRCDISVALLDQDPEAYRIPDAFPLHRLDCGHSLVRSVRRLSALVDEVRPDVALSFLTRGNLATVIAMRRRGKPAVISERVDTSAHLATGRAAWISKLMVKWSYPKAARVIAVSDGVAATLARDFGIAPGQIDVIANPVDADAIAERARAEPAIPVTADDAVVMGRLVENKNPALAVRAFAASRATGRLILLGDGPDREALLALPEARALGDRLVLPGFVTNPHAVIARAGFLLSASNAEGFPNALVEALACGVPVVVTDCPSGPAEILAARPAGEGSFAEGRGGLIVPVNDRAAMTAAIDAMQDEALRGRLSAAGLERVRDFSVERAVARYWSVIEQALAQDGRAGA